ncbi:hypothetical protein AB1Y20_007441 [Prymnesium parvum]|uniref:Uncharacterized protein n=1 Tax=Prymnesium parvum TaxID=97485 RepID=A0AB34IXH0_PRYPA
MSAEPFIRCADAIISLAYFIIPIQIMHFACQLQPKLVVESTKRQYIMSTCARCTLWIAAFVLSCGIGHMGRAIVSFADTWASTVLTILQFATAFSSVGCTMYLQMHGTTLAHALATLEVHPLGQAKEAARRAAQIAQRHAEAHFSDNQRAVLTEFEEKQEKIRMSIERHREEMLQWQSTYKKGENAMNAFIASMQAKMALVQESFSPSLHGNSMSSQALAMEAQRLCRFQASRLLNALCNEDGIHILRYLDTRCIMRLKSVCHASLLAVEAAIMQCSPLRERIVRARMHKSAYLQERDFSAVSHRDASRMNTQRGTMPGRMAARMMSRREGGQTPCYSRGGFDRFNYEMLESGDSPPLLRE